MAKEHFLERRIAPNESPLFVTTVTLLAIFMALVIGGFLFLPFGSNPLQAYGAMLQESFGNLRGIGYTLINATPLIFVGLGTIFAWRSGFFYLGFEGAMLIGAAMAAWLALLALPGGILAFITPTLFFPLVFLGSFLAGGGWAGVVGFLRARYGGNEVLISLMMNYLAVFFINYLVSGPLRAPGDLPQTLRIPELAILPFFLPGTRAHTGFLVAIAFAVIVLLILRKTPLGYELIVSGLSQRAALYGGINVRGRLVLAAFVAGGLAALAGLVEVLGVQYRLLDGVGLGTGFEGIVAALLGKLHPVGVLISSILYAGMGVGADAMQRRAGLPSSVIFTVQSLIVLFILASDILRYYRINPSVLRKKPAQEPLAQPETSKTTKV